jgi:hypothetical protein
MILFVKQQFEISNLQFQKSLWRRDDYSLAFQIDVDANIIGEGNKMFPLLFAFDHQ